MTSSGEELQPAKWFSHFFAKLSGFEPYPWQTILFRELLESRNPEELCLPTGLGKTAVMHVWLLALAWEIVHPPRKQAVPRRLVWVYVGFSGGKDNFRDHLIAAPLKRF